MPEKATQLSTRSGRCTAMHTGIAQIDAPLSSQQTAPIAPVAVVMLNRARCVKHLNCTAREIFGDNAEGQAWPLLRNASFKSENNGSLLRSKRGDYYQEQHSTEMRSGEHIICLQPAVAVSGQSEALMELGEGVAKLVHQVRTPLTAAALYLDQLTRQLGHEPALQRLSRKPAEQLRNAEQIIGGALGLLAPQATRSSMISGTEILEQLHQQCAVVVASMGAHLHCELIGEDSTLHADMAAVVSALSNIVINAAQHPAPNRLLRICVLAYSDADQLVVEINDTGAGVATGSQENIFKAFESNRIGGTGLGLPVAQHVLGAFGASIDVSENSDRGASFRVCFPTESQEQAA